MPYVKKEKRPGLDKLVAWLWAAGVKADGDLNYILYAFCKRCVEPGYGNYKNYCAELRACATEIERRLLGPYEDEAARRNGDVE